MKDKQIEEILEISMDLAHNHKELKHWAEGLAELAINQLSDGDQEKKNLLYLQLEQNMLRSKRGEL